MKAGMEEKREESPLAKNRNRQAGWKKKDVEFHYASEAPRSFEIPFDGLVAANQDSKISEFDLYRMIPNPTFLSLFCFFLSFILFLPLVQQKFEFLSFSLFHFSQYTRFTFILYFLCSSLNPLHRLLLHRRISVLTNFRKYCNYERSRASFTSTW